MLIKILSLLVFIVLPGAWVTMGFSLRGLTVVARFALAIALSPVVLAIEWFALKLVGVGANLIPSILFFGNLPVLIFIIKRARQEWASIKLTPAWFYGAVLFLITASVVLLRWIVNPLYRKFSWHALMHSDFVYAIFRGGLLPEEPELAGLALSFGWVPHISIGVMGSFADWAPTLVYPVLNMVMLFAAFVLCYELGKNALGLSRPGALLTSSFLFLGTNILGAIVWIIKDDVRAWNYFLGDPRYTPLIGKYHGFETMPYGFALLIGLVLVCVLTLRSQVRHSTLLISLLLAGIGIVYPILLPVGCFLAGGLFLIQVWTEGIHKTNRRQLAFFVGAVALSVIIAFAFLFWVTQDRVSPSFQFALSGRKSKLFHLLFAFLPLLLIVLPYLVKTFRKRDRQAILLTTASLFSALLYVIADLDNLEYKYVLCATIMIAPVCAASIDSYLARYVKVKWALAFLIPIILVGIHTLFFFKFSVNNPSSLANAPQVSEESFQLSLDPSEEDSLWLNAVLQNTPVDTVMVVDGASVHLGPFLNRSLYIPAEVDGRLTAGYSLDNEDVLINQRGYSTQLWEDRKQTTTALFEGSSPVEFSAAVAQIQSLNRPVAIHFQQPDSVALKWLEDSNLGSQIYEESGHTVWFIPAP